MGIWRIPVDEIDRPGSFASHMNRSIVLLLEVLFQLKDHDTLVKVSFMLQRTPDQGKKYLRDVDRQVLAKRAFFLTVKVLEDNLSSLTGVPSMGEMTTTDASKRPGSDESKHAPPKKLTEGDAMAVPREASQAQLSTTPCVEKGIKVQEVYLGRMETSTEVHKGSDEPMDLDPAHWRRPSADPRGNQTEAETSASVGELQLKAAASSSRTPELSLEELSISSRQQQLIQAAAGVPKVAVATGGTDQGMLRRPNRKRKLLEDVESGKTLLLDAYRVWQQGQKVMTYDLARIEKIMSETYMLIKQVDEDVALDQAVKFCQIQLATSAQRQSSSDTPTTPKYAKDHIFFPAALSTPVLLSHATCHPLSNPEGPAKVVYPEPPSKLSRPQTSGLHEQTQHRRAAGHPMAGHHTAGHPTSGHHTAGHPTVGHPTVGHPTVGHPTVGHPTAGHPTAGHPTAGHPTAGHPTAGHHTAGHHTAGHTTVGHPTAGHPTVGHTTAGHPMAVGHPPAAALAFLTHTEERGEPSEGLAYRQQESNLCQQMKLATVSTETASGWFQEETATCSSAQPGPGPRPGPGPDQQLPDPSRIRSRVPPNMPKLFIPSTVTKFPPEITVTPPTPTLLSPKGSISEETKQRLKNVILSSQSAATVKKDTLSQPALEVQETSSQESSLESESEDEEDDYMDV